MSVIGLFILSVASLLTLWSGQVEYVLLAVVLFIAAWLTDLMGQVGAVVQKHYAAKNVEVLLGGMGQGPASQGLRDAIGATTRKAWQQAQADAEAKKRDSN